MDQLFEDKGPSLPRSNVPTLVHLCISCLRKNTSQIQDVGPTPYHLLEPVLERMSAKQLNQLETASPQLIPFSDKLWVKLIEREFPDRPGKLPLDIKSSMPYKTLFERYVKDREEFKQDSAMRLRNITHKLERKKLQNKVVKLDQVLKDPTIRRRPSRESWSTMTSAQNKGSILSKVRRDMQSRSIMFTKSPAMKRYDPFDVFKTQPERIRSVKTTPVKRTTFFDGSNDKPTINTTTTTNNTTTTKSESPPSENKPIVVPVLRKRKSAPSIFLKSKRPAPPPVKRTPEKKKVLEQSPTKIKQIKSSIFS
ncbi:uncharacterized protein SPAPADRAFT_58109 [Spathaspora passalidarum NRRL Y-27907]|uniref:Elongin-A n=1 Tax=Spathaspora passalidarum (strain NRRL Y-27907 / 11-Y1) TaxID=619300 RepID=G3AFJ7_SPAPN|nr:uncharacterized protein SPAPADRAFT_58109 [Spathaspora passalidarum NRRL Y-27907]EGW34986.1 hypothetical protein SPAPADRAFT_58109 [Spathaspora passalidarum NRRL Y-27907]